jgi:hypothetical protein
LALIFLALTAAKLDKKNLIVRSNAIKVRVAHTLFCSNNQKSNSNRQQLYYMGIQLCFIRIQLPFMGIQLDFIPVKSLFIHSKSSFVRL